MATFETLAPVQVSAKASINQLLMYGNTTTDTGGIKFDLDALNDRLIVVEGGGSGGGSAEDSGAIGEILLGGETNEAIYWKRRFSPFQHMLNEDSKNPSGFDPEGRSLKNQLVQFIQSNDVGIDVATATDWYQGQYLTMAKGSKIAFKIKKGVNFFSLGGAIFSTACDNLEVLIDGATPSSLGLLDENGAIAPNTLTYISATTLHQKAFFFYGLDGEEHTIELHSNDSGVNIHRMDFVEVGYRTENPAIDESVHINAGKALVRGSEISFSEGTATFAKAELNGHTGAIVLDKATLLTALDGESPAMTQCKPEEAITFSSAVTNLKVKNNFFFPNNGICLMSTPYGAHHLFSYTDKIDASIQSHQFDNVLWQSQPTINYTPLTNFTGASGTATGDLSINYWGTAPIEITTSNNKIDFKVTIAGVTTTHAATVASGRYAADLIPLEVAVRAAMQAAKSISGEYHVKYNETSQLWSMYVDDEEIENFELLFSSGANLANSIHPTLGFATTDTTGGVSYTGVIAKQHLSCRALEPEKVMMHSEDPRIKYSEVNSGTVSDRRGDIEDRLGFGTTRLNAGADVLMQIFPDQDCCGLATSFAKLATNSMLTFQIDDGPFLYLMQSDTSIADTANRGIIQTGFISFPRGSRKITIRSETSAAFSLAGSSDDLLFVGATQYFTKPAYEKLTLEQSILKTFDISPASLYETIYGHNAGTIYSPAAQDDNINTITESGSWVGGAPTSTFNAGRRTTAINGDYVDINFTLVGDGGGISIRSVIASLLTRKVAMFISTAAIVEGTDRVGAVHQEWNTTYYDQNSIGITGLPAGTYIARFKNEDARDFYIDTINIIDTVAPQENANTITDVNNTGQSVTYPVNTINAAAMRDSEDRVPTWLERSGYNEGRVSKLNYALNAPIWVNYDDATTLTVNAAKYYGAHTTDSVAGSTLSMSVFAKSFASIDCFFTPDLNAAVQLFIDGVQTLNTYSQRVQVKGGSAPSAIRDSINSGCAKNMNLACTHNTGLLFNMTDTRGIRLDQTVILDDGTNKEKAVIGSFVVGVSITIKKALTTVVAANVTRIEFQGFHTFDLVGNNAEPFRVSGLKYEPLKVSPSKAVQRRGLTFEYEKVSITHEYVVNDDLYYPVHSDGVVGNWRTSTLDKIQGDGAAYDFPQDLKNVVGAGKVKITSERLVPVLDERERF